jgi:hypothetical protein
MTTVSFIVVKWPEHGSNTHCHINAEFEGIEELYLYSIMSTLTFTMVKLPGRSAEQQLPFLFSSLKEE